MLSAAPMPCPIDLYHRPASFSMSMPAACQRLISAICVPDRSPREMKGALLALIVCSAKTAFLPPLMPAGALLGPIIPRTLYITELRFPPSPSATNFSSASFACTNTTSASPRRAVSRAWPVPCAKTLTVIPVFCLKIGNRYSNKPESCVDVVDATTIDLSCAEANEICARTNAIPNQTGLRHLGMELLLLGGALVEWSCPSRNAYTRHAIRRSWWLRPDGL